MYTYICIYTYFCICTYIYIYVYTYAHTYEFSNFNPRMFEYSNIHQCVQVGMSTYHMYI